MSVEEMVTNNSAQNENDKALQVTSCLLSLGLNKDSQGFAYVRDAIMSGLCEQKS